MLRRILIILEEEIELLDGLKPDRVVLADKCLQITSAAEFVIFDESNNRRIPPKEFGVSLQ